ASRLNSSIQPYRKGTAISRMLTLDRSCTIPCTRTIFSKIFHCFTSSLIFALASGKRMPRGDEHEITGIDECVTYPSQKMAPEQWMVDIFPVLSYRPRFFCAVEGNWL